MRERFIHNMARVLFMVVIGMIAVCGLSSVVAAQDREELMIAAPGRDILDSFPLTIVVDVATDARSMRLNNGLILPQAKRGDSFIVEGKIYPAGTIPAGGTLQAPGTFNPDAATGSIGKWVLRGTANFDFTEIIGGADPFVFGTQYFIFNDGRVLVTEGPHGGRPQLRVITGGAGSYSGAAGEVVEEVIGVNVTGLLNQRFTFRIKRQSVR